MHVLITAPSTFSLMLDSDKQKLEQAFQSERYASFRGGALAVLTTRSECNDIESLLARYPDFEIRLAPNDRTVALVLINPPPTGLPMVKSSLPCIITYMLFYAIPCSLPMKTPLQRLTRCALLTLKG